MKKLAAKLGGEVEDLKKRISMLTQALEVIFSTCNYTEFELFQFSNQSRERKSQEIFLG